MARLLSIEDDADIQHIMGYTLQKHGYEIHYAFNGKEGYEKVLSLHPDLVILDLMLPVMNGVELLKLLQTNRETRDIPIIVVTGYGDEVSLLERSIRALGAIEYIQKPIAMGELLSRIKSILARRPHAEAPPAELRKGAVRADPRFRTVWINDRLVGTLPPKRFQLLCALMERKGGVKRPELIAKVWGSGESPNVLEKTIQRLREDFGDESRRIQTAAEGYELIG